MLIESAIAGGAIWGYKKVKQNKFAKFFHQVRPMYEEEMGFFHGSLQLVHGYFANTTRGNIAENPNADVILLATGHLNGITHGFMIELNVQDGEILGHAFIPAEYVLKHKYVFKGAKKFGRSFLQMAATIHAFTGEAA
jgi:hypothetical protein